MSDLAADLVAHPAADLAAHPSADLVAVTPASDQAAINTTSTTQVAAVADPLADAPDWDLIDAEDEALTRLERAEWASNVDDDPNPDPAAGIQLDIMSGLGYALLALNEKDESVANDRIDLARELLTDAGSAVAEVESDMFAIDSGVLNAMLGAAWSAVTAAERTLPTE